MAWVTEYWSQDDAVFYGYPVPAETEIPEITDKSDIPSKWQFDDKFYDYPHTMDVPEIADKSDVYTKWLFDNKFYGYPHVFDFSVFPIISKYPVFTGFSMDGIGADFRQMNKSIAVSLPDKISFKFDIKETLTL